jgi:hypothetical protein
VHAELGVNHDECVRRKDSTRMVGWLASHSQARQQLQLQFVSIHSFCRKERVWPCSSLLHALQKGTKLNGRQ